VPFLWSEVARPRDHFGSGGRAKRMACSACDRNPELISKATPSARAAASMRSNASATSGPHGLALAVRQRPAVAATGPELGQPRVRALQRQLGLSNRGDRRRAPLAPSPASKRSRTVTRSRTGAIDPASGNPTSASRASFAAAVRAAAERPSSRNAALLRCRGLTAPSITGGSNSRKYAPCMARPLRAPPDPPTAAHPPPSLPRQPTQYDATGQHRQQRADQQHRRLPSIALTHRAETDDRRTHARSVAVVTQQTQTQLLRNAHKTVTHSSRRADQPCACVPACNASRPHGGTAVW
jgi:hypothetical protein